MSSNPEIHEVDLQDKDQLELWETRAALARKKSWTFMRYFVNTKDEHDPAKLYKPFPVRGYLRVLDRIINEVEVCYLEKTRQMKISWIFAAWTLWDALFKNSRLIADQSENQKKANALVKRQTHIYKGLLQYAALFAKSGGLPRAKEAAGKIGTGTALEFPDHGSEIQAIPQGEDAVQSYTWSFIFGDEINLQIKSGEGYAAAMPAIDGGGKWFGVGTPNGRTWGYWIRKGFDYQTGKSLGENIIDSKRVKDKPIQAPAHLSEEAQRWWIEKALLDMSDEDFWAIPLEVLVACCPGMRIWRNKNGINCVSLHYTADPYKDPATEVGKIWYEREHAKYTQAQWGRHYEIQYDTFLGRPVIGNFEIPIHVKKPAYDSNSMLYLTLDFGDNCGCFFAQYKNIENYSVKRLSIIDEIFLEDSNTVDLAKETVERLKGPFYRSWQNNYIRAFCDPAGHAEEATTRDKSLNTSIKILQSVGIYPYTKKFGVPESTEMLEMVFALVLPDGRPAIEIHERCEYVKGVCQNLHFPDNGRSGYYEKDGHWDHGGDMLRYLIMNLFDYMKMLPGASRNREEVQFVTKRRRYTGETIGRQKIYLKPRRGPVRRQFARR